MQKFIHRMRVKERGPAAAWFVMIHVSEKGIEPEAVDGIII